MLDLRLVVDTNIVVSAALNADGLPRTAVLLAITKPARLYVSPPILAEYDHVLGRPELNLRRSARLQLLDLIRKRSVLIKPRMRLNVTSDPDDNIFIECADAARADYLITGNRRHFPLYWKTTKVITAREFLDLAAPHLLPN
jgi:putative PIN family toxin of toxin-antitoxin system